MGRFNSSESYTHDKTPQDIEIETLDFEAIEKIKTKLKDTLDSFDTAYSKERDLYLYTEATSDIARLPKSMRDPYISQLATAMRKHAGFSQSAIELRVNQSVEHLNPTKRRKIEDYATDLYNITKDSLNLYYDEPTGEYYAQFISHNGQAQIHPLYSKPVRHHLHHVAFQEFGRALRNEIFRTVLAQLESDEAIPIDLSLRVASLNDCIYYDLCDSSGSIVEISPHGWKVITSDSDKPPKPLFRPNSLMKAQVMPSIDTDSNITALKKFIKLLSIPDDQEILVAVWLIAAFIPSLVTPILNIYGSHGSGKTSLTRSLLHVASPTNFDVLTAPTELDQAITQASQSRILVYDNLYIAQAWFSNFLSNVCTGTANIKRKQYTNNDPYSITVKRPILINGILRLGLNYPDLQDRIIAVELQRRGDSQNVPDSLLTKREEELLPETLGAIFTILSKAIALKPTVSLTEHPRLAEFTVWGCAISKAMNQLGFKEYSQEAFLHAYYSNIETVNLQVLERHPIALCVLALLSENPEFDGTSSQLLNKLKALAVPLSIDTNDKTLFPQSSFALSRKLNQLAPNLKAVGITISKGYTHGGIKTLHLEKSKSAPTPKRKYAPSPQ